ncbi:MAG: sigma-54 dependent transcriptional regulator [Bacteroidetes bacterium]|nr:sigma-54 dependent transcriptional regulator [Bacteroidota bacterium]MBU1721018.1 sigma-54 dependent transcriptional regulator [Bacteroidota bacterium]
MAKILIIDDEQSIRFTLRDILEYEKFTVAEAESGEEGIDKVKNDEFDIILCDIKMPRMDGIETLEELQKITDTPVIMISGHGTIETAVEAIKKGAFDYISKPPDLNRLLITLRNALDRSNLVQETRSLRRKVNKAFDMIGESQAIVEIKEMIQRVAPTDARVLITGDNGTGKELVAKWIHEYSNRSKCPFVEVNCAAIPSELIESVLFGHEKGSFTSAIKQRKGDFEQATGGTLFLDEIGDMSLSAQAKVLRALQESKIMRVGGEKDISVDVRIVAATNKNLKEEIKKGTFREDLYHRLSVILIHVPSLNDRWEDIPLLTEHFLKELGNSIGKPGMKISEDAMTALKNIKWTGNVRELRNIIERLAILCDKEITGADVKKYAGN